MLTNYVYKLRPNQTQDLKMSNWVDMLRSHYNWCLNDRITQYSQQFIQGNIAKLGQKVKLARLPVALVETVQLDRRGRSEK